MKANNAFVLNPTGIAWVGLYAEDLDALTSFYESKLGLRLLERGERARIFDAGGGALFEIWGGGSSPKRRKVPSEQSVLIGFLVDRLEPIVEELKSRGVLPTSGIGAYMGTRWIHYADIEGNRFELKDLRG